LIGSIIIESLVPDPNLVNLPVILWATSKLVFKINTFLLITGIIIDGINVHVDPKLQCTSANISNCCSFEKITDQSSVCYLKQEYQKFSGDANNGFIVLNTNAICQIDGFFMKNFYSVLNYKSFISNSNQQSYIWLNNLKFTKSFFLKGITYFTGETPKNLTFLAQNFMISEWNFLNVILPLDESKLFYLLSPGSLIFGFYNVLIPITITNITFFNGFSDFLLLVGNSTANVSFLNFEGVHCINPLKIFGGAFFNLSNSIFEKISSVHFLNLQIASLDPGNYVYLLNNSVKNSYGNFIILTHSYIFSDILIVDNITYPLFSADTGAIIDVQTGSNAEFRNLLISNIFNAANTILYCSYDSNTLKIIDSVFTNFTFFESFVFFISYQNATLDNVSFSHINCTKSLLSATAGSPVQLILNNSNFFNISGKNLGPFLFVSANNNKIFFINMRVNWIISGEFFSLTMPLNGIVFYFYNELCSFINILFRRTLYLNEIFQTNGGTLSMTNSIFTNISVLEGEGHIMQSRNSTVLFINVTFDSIFIKGNGGLSFSFDSTLIITKSKFNNISKSEEGFIYASDCLVLLLKDSLFENINSFKFSLLYANNVQNLTIYNCEFRNITAEFDTSVFWITSKNFPNSTFYITKNIFSFNSAKLSIGGNIVFSDCNSPIIIQDNIFTQGSSLSGSLIFASSVYSLEISNCSFANSIAVQEGGALSFSNGNFVIFNCSFSNNSVINGKGGHIYVENSNLSISNVSFTNEESDEFLSNFMQGSCLYGLFTNLAENYKLFIENSMMKNLKQHSDVIYISSSSLYMLTNFSRITISKDISLTENGIITCYCDDIYMENINIEESKILLGNFFDFNTKNGKLEMRNISLKNNLIETNGVFFKVSNTNDTKLEGFLFMNNRFEGSYFLFSNSITSSILINNCSVKNNSNIDIGAQIFAEVTNGKSLVFTNISMISSNCSLFWIDSAAKIEINTINCVNLFANHLNLIYIANNNDCSFSNLQVKDSNFYSSSINSDFIVFSHVNFSNITSQFEVFLTIFSNNPGLTQFFIDSFYLSLINKGLLFKNLDSITIENLFFNNEFSSFSSQNALYFLSISSIFISNSSIKNILNSRGIQFSLSSSTKSTINLSNLSLNSCGGANIQQGGGFYVDGYFKLNISNSNFINNRASSGNVFYLTSSNPLSNLLIKNNFFQINSIDSNSDLTILIPNDTFYSNFYEENLEFFNNSQLNITSFTKSIKVFIGDSDIEVLEDQIIDIYSGESLDLKFVAYNHFNYTTKSSNRWLVELTQKNTAFEMRNSRTIFIDSTATLSEMQIIVPFSQQNSSLQFAMQVKIEKTENFTDKIFERSFVFRIKSCDKGKTIVSDKCVGCGSDTFSFEDQPTNETDCVACPLNAKCLDGISIIPKKGYWNSNSESPLITKCDTEESCNFVNLVSLNSSIRICEKGYFGNICGECSENYGRTLNRKCVSCEDSYLGTHILRVIIKWMLLACFSVFQYWIFKEILNTENSKNLQIKYDLFNVFCYHFSIFAIIVFLQNKPDLNFSNFMEVQSVFSFFENNLYLIFCIFPEVRDFKLSIIVFLYLIFIVIFQFFFAFLLVNLIKFIKKKLNSEKKFEHEILFLFYVVFFNSFISFSFYMIGLVFYTEIANNLTISIFFKEIIYNSGEFFIVLFALAFIIAIFMIITFFLICKKLGKENLLNFFGCGYDLDKNQFVFFDYLCLFFMILLAHYGVVSQTFSKFARNIFMIYCGIIVSFRYQKECSLMVLGFKIVSCAVLIVSFYEVFEAIIVLNTLFGVAILGYQAYLSLVGGKKQRQKSL